MRAKSMMVYARGRTLVVETVHRAANAAQVPGEVRVLDSAELDEQGLGEAVRSALASVREGVDPDDFPLEPLYAAFGARSWRSFVRGVSGACVNELEHGIKAMPLLNRGDAGFDFDVDRARTLPLDVADTEIGAAVAAALMMAEPPFDLRDPEAQDPADASRAPAELPPVPDARMTATTGT